MKDENRIADFQIVQAVLQGDREAYSALVRLYHGKVLGLALSILLDRAEAEDAAQETFVKAFASLDSYRRDLSFSAWLCRIASNHCLDQLRRKKRQKTDSLDGLMDQQGDSFDPRGSGVLSNDAPAADKQEILSVALRALATLAPDHRQALILREVDGLSYVEMTAVLKCSLDAVKSRLRRARQELQERARHFLDHHSFHQ